MKEIKKIAYSSLQISNIGRKQQRKYTAVLKPYTLQTYQLSRIHVFLSSITQLGISSQMSRKFTILPHIFQLLTHFNFIEHSGNAISCNLAPSKTQNFFSQFESSGRHYIYTVLTQMNNQMFARLTLQEAKSSKFLPLKFTYVTAACLN